MLPGFLESTYKKYKNDTSIFVKWLCEAGSKCGYAISTAQTVKEEPAAKGPRLKGKARKEAKQAINSRFPGTALKFQSLKFNRMPATTCQSLEKPDADNFKAKLRDLSSQSRQKLES